MDKGVVVKTSVFAATPAGGNPCPVVLEADGFSGEEMQETAFRFGAETVFVLRPDRPGADVRLRYFVPRHEMEMCVHATVAAVTVLVKRCGWTRSPVRAETPLGILPVEWRFSGKELLVSVEQFPPQFSEHNPSPAEVAEVLGIREADMDRTVGPVQSVSVSRPKLLVPLRGEDVLNRLKPRFEDLWALCDAYGTTGVYPFALSEKVGEKRISARQFPKGAGYDEDPATGLAAGALGAYLVHYGALKGGGDGWHGFTVEQGAAIGRPSRMLAEVCVEGGKIKRVRITGSARILTDP